MAIPPGRAFLPPVTITHAAWAKKIVLGRFTRSGLLDFAVLHWETGGRCYVDGTRCGKGFVVRPFVNTGGAGVTSFAAAPKLEFIDDAHRIYDMYPSDMAAGDVNGDGLDDIVVANAHADRLFVYLSNGDGTFQAPIEITATGGDDPSYVTLGHFSGSGKLDAAVLNIRRHDPAPGMNFEWKFAFLFGNGDGTFQTPIVMDEGDWSFGGDADDGGGYYKSNTFHMTTMQRGVVIGLRARDAVSLNGVMRWWDDTAIQTDGKGAQFHFRANPGTDTFAFYGPPRSDIAFLGGQLILTSFNKPAEMSVIPYERGSAANLNAAWPGIHRYSGEHFLMADFDNDGLLDIVRFRDHCGSRNGTPS